MRTGGCFCAARFFAVAFILVCLRAGAALSQSSSPGDTLLFFSGTDLWRSGVFAHGGLLWSPEGLDREGFTLKAALSGGSYRYTSGALGNATVIGRELTAQLMPGWRFKNGGSELKIFAGPDLQIHRLWPDDPGSGLRGSKTGVRAAFEFWSEPTANMMFSADALVSSVSRNYFAARLATGWRVFDHFYLGPEAQVFSSDDYRQRRYGIHFTSMKTEQAEWSAALGWARDTDDRSSLYARIGVLTRR